MVLPDIGGIVYNFGIGVASLATSPLNDRALVVRRVNISNPSGTDNWTFSVGGRELFRVRELATGNQHLMRVSDGPSAVKINFWTWVRDRLGLDPSIPVPLGQTLTVASVGGATADIDVEAYEVSPGDANVVGLQHYLGNTFLMPIGWFLGAAVAAAGATQFDTQVAPGWIPSIINGNNIPPNWKIELLALFLEGAGVNTFSGAANHQSTTQDMRLTRNAVQEYTRASLGIPLRGSASAAGSANVALGQQSGIFDPFERSLPDTDPVLPVPLVLQGGDTLQQFLDVQGDVTGGASYATALQVAIARVTVPVT